MRKIFSSLTALSMLILASCETQTDIRVIETTDIHGCLYPINMITMEPAKGSMARIASYVESVRDSIGRDNVLLLDDGDILQGQPAVYYYNYIDTVSPHLASAVMNFMGYDASAIGNHDVETGHSVYDRWVAENEFPVLGANIIDVNTGEPYLKPYEVFERGGAKIAVLGMITPAIPGWLPRELWTGLEFADMQQTAEHWVPIIKEKEKPDVLIGLFHSGRDSTKTTGDVIENASLMVAKNVQGFDIVLMGHDHSPFLEKVTNVAGKSVLVANPGNNGHMVADINIKIGKGLFGNASVKSIDGSLVSVDDMPVSEAYEKEFEQQRQAVELFVSQPIGHIDTTLRTRDAYFGPSAFIDFTHALQLALTGADISFAAPLSYDATIDEGDITISDMFSLYKYENYLYTMALTGQEIKDYLEMSYDIWTNQMQSPSDHLLRFRDADNAIDKTHTGFQYPSYNFDSAAGIIYTVDVTKPRGEKISIKSMSDGRPFDLSHTYSVAINSYRGNGGGNLLTEGAGIPIDELPNRVKASTDRDLRYYMIRYIESQPSLSPKAFGTWRFVPESMVKDAAARDRQILFPN